MEGESGCGSGSGYDNNSSSSSSRSGSDSQSGRVVAVVRMREYTDRRTQALPSYKSPI